MRPRRNSILASLVLVAATAMGDTPAAAPHDPARGASTPPAEIPPSTNALFSHVEGNIYALGAVRLDKRHRTITFPATVNMSEGAVEYALVHDAGKVHESVLKTAADPLHVHLARLLIWPDADANKVQNAARTPRDLTGPRIEIQVQWTGNDGHKSVPLEDLVWNTLTRSQMVRGPWVFNGSRLIEGTFLAQRGGSIIAIYADPDALVNNPRPGRNDDEIWTANTRLVPPVGTRVTVTMQLESENEK